MNSNNPGTLPAIVETEQIKQTKHAELKLQRRQSAVQWFCSERRTGPKSLE